MAAKKPRSRSSSIAKRLNSALVWRKYLRNLICDILLAALFLAIWCLAAEADQGGRISNVTNRSFYADNFSVGIYSIGYFTDDVQEFFRLILNGQNPKHGNYTLFDGIYYRFDVHYRADTTSDLTVQYEYITEIPATEPAPTVTDQGIPSDATDTPETAELPAEYPSSGSGSVHPSEIDTMPPEDVPHYADGEQVLIATSVPMRPGTYTAENYRIRTYSVNASATLLAILAMIIVTFVLQTLISIVQSIGGSGFVKKYLRPIDDMALMAEKLSAEKTSSASRTAAPSEIRAETARLERKAIAQQQGTDADNNPLSGGYDIGEIEAAIDMIDTPKDRVDLRQTELDGIESAINNMLRRLDEERRKQMRFVDDASHELRTPIAVLQGYINMLDRWGKDDPTVRDEAISAIKTEVDHMQTLVDQLLFLARGEMDRHVLDIVGVDVAEVLYEILDESNMLDTAHDYTVAEPREEDYVAGKLKVDADIAMLKQCLRILRDNSIRYTPEGGSVTFKCYHRQTADRKAREVCIEVSDTGIGIPPDELPRIFDRLFRGSNARTMSAGGSGLGLSLALCIVEKHSGRIETVSGQGVGTKMTVVLPEGKLPIPENPVQMS